MCVPVPRGVFLIHILLILLLFMLLFLILFLFFFLGIFAILGHAWAYGQMALAIFVRGWPDSAARIYCSEC